MIFEWNTYDYFYAYHPEVAVFGKSVTVNGKSVILYKLVVEDEDESPNGYPFFGGGIPSASPACHSRPLQLPLNGNPGGPMSPCYPWY